jgi:D-lactate dehydrogenase
MINATSLAGMKPGAVLINTSRGGLIETGALIAALKDGRLAGVGLDVYEMEEGVFFENHSELGLQDDQLARLLTFPNVLVTAHQGFPDARGTGQYCRNHAGQCHGFRAGQAAGQQGVSGLLSPAGGGTPSAERLIRCYQR